MTNLGKVHWVKNQLLSREPHPEIGNPWRLDTPEEWTVPPPVPSNYWARGNLIELWKFKKTYKMAGFKHHPNAPGYDYSSATNKLFVQMKSLSNPDGALPKMKDAIDKLANTIPNDAPADVKCLIHIVKPSGSSSAQLEVQIANYISNHSKSSRFSPTVLENFTY